MGDHQQFLAGTIRHKSEYLTTNELAKATTPNETVVPIQMSSRCSMGRRLIVLTHYYLTALLKFKGSLRPASL